MTAQELEEREPDRELPDKDARNWAMICHLAALAGFVIPFGNVFGPLAVWMMKKDLHAFIDSNGREALNFQLTLTIALIVAAVLRVILIGFLLLPALALFALVVIIIAAIRANDGIPYRYPLTIRFFR